MSEKDTTLDRFVNKEEKTGWSNNKLEDLLTDLLTGNRPTGGGHDEGEYISIGGTQIDSEGYIDLHNLVYIPSDYFEKVSDTQLQEHDILMVKDGANTGDVAIAWSDRPDIVTNEHVLTLRTNKEVNSPYLFYYLLSHRGWRQLKGTITGSAQEGINKSFSGKIDIEYPSLEKQRKIASVLYNVDEAIQKIKEIVDQLGRVRHGLYLDLFRYWSDNTEYDSLIGEYPREWSIKELSEITTVTDAEHFTPDYVDSGIPVIRPGDLSPGRISLNDIEKRVNEETYEELTRRHTPTRDDIVYSRSQNFAVASQVLEDGKYCIGQDMVVIETEGIDRAFLLHLLNSPLVRKQAIRMSSGSTFSRVNLGDIRSYQIPIPEKEIQERIGEVLSTVEEQIISKESYFEQVRRLKQGLMQDLLSGEVRTANYDIDILSEVEIHD